MSQRSGPVLIFALLLALALLAAAVLGWKLFHAVGAILVLLVLLSSFLLVLVTFFGGALATLMAWLHKDGASKGQMP